MTLCPSVLVDLKSHIARVDDFPIEGITFWDVTPLIGDKEAFARTIDAFVQRYRDQMIQKVVAAEARGFLFGAPIAKELNAGLVPVRKANKLPRDTVYASYSLEYGEDQVEMHKGSIAPGERVLVFDDVLATGGTAHACAELVEKDGGEVHELCFLMDLDYVPKTHDLSRHTVFSLLQYTEDDLQTTPPFKPLSKNPTNNLLYIL
jgi:adenine phosphoribosyltransferase